MCGTPADAIAVSTAARQPSAVRRSATMPVIDPPVSAPSTLAASAVQRVEALAVDVDHGHRRPLGGETERRRSTEATGAGDERLTSGDSQPILLLLHADHTRSRTWTATTDSYRLIGRRDAA